jgi:hypothetical protein
LGQSATHLRMENSLCWRKEALEASEAVLTDSAAQAQAWLAHLESAHAAGALPPEMVDALQRARKEAEDRLLALERLRTAKAASEERFAFST